MKPSPLTSLAVTVGIVAAAMSAAGCSQTGPNPTPSGPATHAATAQAAATTEPTHAVSYSSQVVLPFGDYINHLAGVAADTAGNVYVLDLHYGQVSKLAPGARSPTTLPFTGLDHPADVAVDPQGNVYVFDDLNFRVLKLPAR